VKTDIKKTTAPEPDLPVGKRIQREVIAWLWVGLIFLLINGTVGQARVIPSGSMERTLLIGDHLIMSRIGFDAGIPFTAIHTPLWRNPHRQQIVIFKPPFGDNAPDYVKRVIGMPGDTLEIHDGSIWINGKKLDEPYLDAPMNPAEHFGPVQVPEGNFFMMGDNRGNSYDSRFWGFVPRGNIIGTPVIIYMSLKAPQEAWDSGGIRLRLLAYANALIHPGTVRWKRLFHTF
jgi:signal peptidase I